MALVSVVPSPIGNLADLTFRGLTVLQTADLIACEDTRHSAKLLAHYNVDKPTVSLHKDNEHRFVPALIQRLLSQNIHLAVLTDAGTPGISDPGFLLVRAALEANIEVDILPGPTAFVPALVGSGIGSERFVFEGFLPPKKGRKSRLEALATEPRTIVLYESPHRLVKTLHELTAVCGTDRKATVARELTKLHQTYHRATLHELVIFFEQHPPKGELVIIVEGCR